MKKKIGIKFEYVEYVLFFAFFIYYIYFQHNYWIELPSMSLFEQIEMAEHYLDGTLGLSNLFSSYSEHGMFATNLLFLLNVELFDMTTTFDIVVNIIIVGVFGLICFKAIRNSFQDAKKDFGYYLAIAVCGFFAFNIVQGSCSGMDMQVRLGLLFGLLCILEFDKILCGDISFKRLTKFSVMTLLYINVFGTLYCMATTAVLFVVIVLRAIVQRKWDKTIWVIVGISIACWLLYFIEYPTAMVSTDVALSGQTTSFTIMELFNTFTFCIRSLLVYSGSFVFGYDAIVDARIPIDLYMVVGFLVVELVLWSAIRFFKAKQYEKTWIPLMLIGYSYAVFCMLILGRNDLGIEWYASTWYHVHTKSAVIGMIWILMKDANENRKKFTHINIASCGIMLFAGLLGTMITNVRIPYVREYLENKEQYLYVVNEEDMPVDEAGMTPLDHNLDMTMKCLEILRDYNLSVFSEPENTDKVYISPTETLNCGEYMCVQGAWEDGWITTSSEVLVKTEEDTHLVMRGYYPFEVTGQQVITVKVGEHIEEYLITGSELAIDIDVPENECVSVKMSCNFSFTNSPDIRKLCFVLQGFDGMTKVER